MTARKDLKKLVRARQARTGERYTTALEQVIADRPSPIPVIELVDLSEEARALGMVARVGMFSDAAARIDGRAALERLREVLRATAGDPATHLFRSVLLDGEPLPPPSRNVHLTLEEGRQFLARARAGLAGVSESGRMIALAVAGRQGPQTVVGLLWEPRPLGPLAGGPSLVLRLPDPFLPESAEIAVMLLRAGWRTP
jgi:hypothetical protein